MRNTLDLSQNPCPDRILVDVGSGFGIGAVGGSAFHFLKGLYQSPNGHRIAGGATAVRMGAPGVAGAFAVWGGVFSASACALVSARRKEDQWNTIAAAACTGAVMHLRQGLRAAAKCSAQCAALFALVEGMAIVSSRSSTPQPDEYYNLPPVDYYKPSPSDDGASPPTTGQEHPAGPAGLFGALFGRRQGQQDHHSQVRSSPHRGQVLARGPSSEASND
ncbi:hypothetical protein U9M48_008313 [Paspalum notatum var. saurae]|uniref:Uncharacterized protein n=1 Tax=Paspalum notatum var. saurae TaxID=547442 RepID=A0AAQ3SPK0_PASNO